MSLCVLFILLSKHWPFFWFQCVQKAVQERQVQLSDLQAIFAHLQEHRGLQDYQDTSSARWVHTCCVNKKFVEDVVICTTLNTAGVHCTDLEFAADQSRPYITELRLDVLWFNFSIQLRERSVLIQFKTELLWWR